MSQETAAIVMAILGALGILITFLTYRIIVTYTHETRKMQEAVSKQSEELTHQVKLSIMPAFTIDFVKRRDIGSESILPKEAWYNLDLLNVGNGVAISIQISPLLVENDPSIFGEKFSDGELIFKWVASLRPSASERLYSVPSLKDESMAVDLMRWMQIYSAAGKVFKFNVRFQDIEGNWYAQTLNLSRNECTPEPVKALSSDEENRLLDG